MSCQTKTLRRSVLAIVAAFALVFAGQVRAELAVGEFAATFGDVEVDSATQFTLSDGIVTLTAPDTVAGLGVCDVTFDLSSYSAPLGTTAPIGVVDNKICLLGDGSTSALYNVVSAKLTQILNTPIAIGYIEMEMERVSNDLQIGSDLILAPSYLTGAITMNGLQVIRHGSYSSPVIGTLSTASLSAVPEPSTLALAAFGLIGLATLALRRKSNKN